MAKYDKSMEYISQTQTLIGQQRKRLVDQDTGEVIEVDQITKRALGQKQFWKIYLMDFLQVLGGFEYKQLDVLIYILEHTEAANNTFIGTYRSLEKSVGVSYDTVRRTITLLQGKGFLKKVSNGVYQVSPTIMMKGSEHKKSLLPTTSTTKSKNHRKRTKARLQGALLRKANLKKGSSCDGSRCPFLIFHALCPACGFVTSSGITVPLHGREAVGIPLPTLSAWSYPLRSASARPLSEQVS